MFCVMQWQTALENEEVGLNEFFVRNEVKLNLGIAQHRVSREIIQLTLLCGGCAVSLISELSCQITGFQREVRPLLFYDTVKIAVSFYYLEDDIFQQSFVNTCGLLM